MHDSDRSGRDYDERQVALILRKAAELQDGSSAEGRGRMSLEEIRQIAREVGIDPRHVAEAAASLERRPSSGLMGAPMSFQSSLSLDRELSDTEVGELLDLVRGSVGLQGTTTQGLDTVEWTGREAHGAYYVTVTRRSGATRMRVGTHRQDVAVMVITGVGLAGFAATLGIGGFIDPRGAIEVAALLGGGMAGTYGAIRTIWTRVARRWDARIQGLASTVRGAIADRARAAVGARED
jgi:hypothetical protein